jgi:phosphate:Na+ symporter
MQQNLLVIGGMLAGGLGLFLLAMRMITDGLKLAAGGALRDLLGHWTYTHTRGIVTGLAITAVVQSSSAVTVATIGFVNAGLLSLYQALGVVYGANIGTTMTGWLVALVGFKIKVEAFALPLVGIGMLFRLTRGTTRLGSLGEALAGFGLFFIGIDVLREAFEGLASGIELQRLSVDGVSGILLYLGIGFLITLFTQSSSAAIAITLTAATGGVLTIEAAAAMVIGANIGTTSTAGFAVIGATPNAKRVAMAHIIFNLMTGVVALLLLVVMLWVIHTTGKMLQLDDSPAVTLALFHTVFNVLGVLLILPISNSLSRFLEKKFRTLEEIEGKPKYLDKTLAATPALALNAIILELVRVGEITRRMAKSALSTETELGKRLYGEHMAVNNLEQAMGDFIARLEKSSLTQDIVERLPEALHVLQHYTIVSGLALNYAKQQVDIKMPRDEEINTALEKYKADAVALLSAANPRLSDYSAEETEKMVEDLHTVYRQLRDSLLEAGARQHIVIQTMDDVLNQINRIDRMTKQTFKGARILNRLLAHVDFPSVGEMPGENNGDVPV